MHAVFHGKALRLSCQASCTVFLLSELNLMKEFLESYFDQLAQTYPVQLEHLIYMLVCIFVDQSEQLHNNQSELEISANWDRAIWTNQIA